MWRGSTIVSTSCVVDTFHEEEESSGEDETLSFLHHTQPRVEDSDLDDSQSERVVRGVGTDKGLSRKNCHTQLLKKRRRALTTQMA